MTKRLPKAGDVVQMTDCYPWVVVGVYGPWPVGDGTIVIMHLWDYPEHKAEFRFMDKECWSAEFGTRKWKVVKSINIKG